MSGRRTAILFTVLSLLTAALFTADLLIGSVCLARGLPLATRNVRHFEGFGIDVVNPWDAEPAWPSCLSGS